MAIESQNPATGEIIKQYTEMTPQEVSQIIDAAQDAFPAWRALSFKERGVYLRKAAVILRERKEDSLPPLPPRWARPLFGLGEVEKCAGACEFYADKAEEFLAPNSSKPKPRRATSPISRTVSCLP